ncbi:hypothetical protein JCM10212_000206 [Sporobolomyces blumeae]
MRSSPTLNTVVAVALSVSIVPQVVFAGGPSPPSFAASPEPFDPIESLEPVKARKPVEKRSEMDKKWVVLPSSMLPSHLRPMPHNSIFHRPHHLTEIDPVTSSVEVVPARPDPTAAPTDQSVDRVSPPREERQRRGESSARRSRRSPPPTDLTDLVDLEDGADVQDASDGLTDSTLDGRDASTPSPSPSPTPASSIAVAPTPVVRIVSTATASNAPASSSGSANSTTASQVNPWDPFEWPQAVNEKYTSSVDQFHQMSALSKVGLATLVTLSTILLFTILICCCKFSRARRRRREDKIRIKAEAERRMAGYRTGGGATTSSIKSGTSSHSTSPSSAGGGGGGTGKKGGIGSWFKRQRDGGGEVLPVADRQREMVQSSLTWDSKRAKSWDARAKGLGIHRDSRTTTTTMMTGEALRRGGSDQVQAPGGSMKSRTRSWGGSTR